MILFCNLVCVYVHKICENKFGGCKKSFSWLGQKVNKNTSLHMATMPTTSAQICAHGHGMKARHLDNIQYVVVM